LFRCRSRRWKRRLPDLDLPCTGVNTLCRKFLRARVYHLAATVDAEPRDASAWCRLGITLEELGDRAGALLALRNALLHEPAHPPAHRALGRLLFECGQIEHALQCFERAAKHHSSE
jgi:Flp pilus assembly protein TadD